VVAWVAASVSVLAGVLGLEVRSEEWHHSFQRSFSCLFEERTDRTDPGLCRFPHEPTSGRRRLFLGLCPVGQGLFRYYVGERDS
jgi:hypothetical protein